VKTVTVVLAESGFKSKQRREKAIVNILIKGHPPLKSNRQCFRQDDKT
jgi:hypothetical protein